MIRIDLSPAVEDYLKVIYRLSAESGRASTKQIAIHMGVAPASVTGMVQKMAKADPPLVTYQKRQGVTLTHQGTLAALETIRRHRLLELFLQQMLGYPWDEVHQEADRLEHVISEAFEERIARALGDPQRDPHGEPIPARDLSLPAYSKLRLADLLPGQQARLQHIDHANPALLRYLGKQGLVPQAFITVLDDATLDHNLRLQVDGQPEVAVLGLQVTRSIYVELV